MSRCGIVTRLVQPDLVERAGKSRRVGIELDVRPEGIRASLHQQNRQVQPTEVLGSKVLGLPRGVQWVAEQKQPGGRKTVSHRQRRSPATQRATTEHQRLGGNPPLLRKPAGVVTNGLEKFRHAVRGPTSRALVAIGKVAASDRQGQSGLESEEQPVITVASGAMEEQKSGGGDHGQRLDNKMSRASVSSAIRLAAWSVWPP